MFLVDYSYENDLYFWFLDDSGSSIVKKSKREIEKELNFSKHLPYLISDRKVYDNNVLNNEECVKYDSFRDEYRHLYKVKVSHPSVVYSSYSNSGLRNKVENSWEDDIRYSYCFAYDLKLLFGFQYPSKIKEEFIFDRKHLTELFRFYEYILEFKIPRVKRVCIDIEVANKNNEYPTPKKAEYPVIACSLKGDGIRKVLLLKRNRNVVYNDEEIEYCLTEPQLIKRIFEITEKYPFVLTFNGDNFDLPYLKNRAKRFNIEVPVIVHENKYSVSCSLSNSIHIDVYKVITHRLLRKMFRKIDEAYDNTLSEISRVLLKDFRKLPKPDFNSCSDKELKEYCLKDSEIVYKISLLDNDKMFKTIFLMSRILNMSFSDITRSTLTRCIKSHLYWIHRLFNYLIPNNKDLETKRLLPVKKSPKRDTYAGALTIEPIKGLYFNVTVIDIGSLYPSVIDNFNLGWDTIACKHEECKHNIVPEHTFHVCTKNKSLFSLSIGYLKELRINKYKPLAKTEKTEMKNIYLAISDVVKLFLNSSYGVFANIIPALASAIAGFARYVFRYLQKLVKFYETEILYGDTDSTFLILEDEKIENIIKKMKQELNIRLEIEKKYKFCILWEKKNYLGVTFDNNIDIKGLVVNKKHMCNFIKTVFNQIKKELSKVENVSDIEAVREPVKNIIKDAVLRLKTRKFNVEDLVFKIKLSKDSGSGQDYDVAKQYEKIGVKKKRGDYIYKVLTYNPTAKPFELVRNINEVNVSQYVNHLFSSLEFILKPLHIEQKNVLYRESLDGFFKENTVELIFE